MSVTKMKPVDVVIVGAGLTGTMVGKTLAETGLRVVGLERGRMISAEDFEVPYAHDELKLDKYSDIFQNLSRETITFRNEMSQMALPMREIGSFKPGECVGGAGMHWGGAAYRLSPWDFETRSRTLARYGREIWPADCTSQDWGVTYDEVEPYYDQFEYLYGVSGKAGNLGGEIQAGGNPFEGPRTRDYPNPPTDSTAGGALFARAAQSLGYRPFPQPGAAMTQPYTNPYRLMLGQCVRGGFCSGFVCANGAKATPLTAVLPALLKHDNYELRPHANVTRVNLDSARKRATGVTYIDARGREVEQPADLVILTSYVFNNVRLMLLSGIGEPYDPASNRGVVGRNYSYQSHGKIAMFFDGRKFNRFMGGGALATAIDELNCDNFDHAGLGFFGGALCQLASLSAAPIRSHPTPPGTPRWGAQWKKTVARYYDSALTIGISGSCQSHRANYLDLDPTYRDANGLPLLRMTFDFRDNDRKAVAHAAAKAAEIAKAMGATHLDVHGEEGKYSLVPYQSTHNMGGAAMGADPDTSAVNKYMQSWDVSNVFVVGGSAFPQNAGYPPTGTIGMLACWAADAIKDQYLKRPGSLV